MEAEETSSYFFGPDNGDDWFYFEDSTTSSSHRSAKKASANPSFKVSTVSGGETTLIQFKHKQRPAHKVLHKGACNFAGLVEEGPGQKDGDLGQAGQRQAILEL